MEMTRTPLALTPRQVEVCILAGMVGSWMSDKAIGRELDISTHTVKQHLSEAAARIRTAHPELDCGSPRRVCQAWVRQAYHTFAQRAFIDRAA